MNKKCGWPDVVSLHFSQPLVWQHALFFMKFYAQASVIYELLWKIENEHMKAKLTRSSYVHESARRVHKGFTKGAQRVYKGCIKGA